MLRKTLLLALSAMLAACSMPSGTRSDSNVRSPASAAITAGGAAGKCLSKLGQSGTRFTPLPDRFYGAGCSTLNAVNLSALQGDRAQFTLANIGPVTCPMADALANWARFGVDRAARQILGSPLARIETMGSYSCRNVANTGRRSAHATANAVDVSALILADGRRISVLSDWSRGSAKERKFLKIIHQSACKRFGTVLGPAYNAAHHNHFHLEQGGQSFCR